MYNFFRSIQKEEIMPVPLGTTAPYYGGKQLANPVQGLSGTGAPPSIVPPEAVIGQTTYTRTTTQTVYMLTSKSPVTWTVLGDDTGSFPITPFVVGPTGQAGYQTIQAAITSASAAGGGTVYVQDGTYTENLTCAASVQVVGVPGFRDDGVIIVGVHTPPASGAFMFNNVTLQSATHIFSSATAGSAHLIIANCNTVVTTGYTYSLLNWTGILEFYNTDSSGTTTDGGVNNTGGATVYTYGAGVGGGTANAMVVSGTFLSSQSNFYCPINPQSGATFALDQATFARTFTASNNSTGTISDSHFSTGATAAFTQSSSAAVGIFTSVITSSNSPAISGAGAGVLSLGGNSYTSNALKAGTLTISYVPMEGTLSTSNSAGASPQTVNARTGQVIFTDTIANGAFATLTLTNSLISSTSIIIPAVSCATVNSACQIVGIVPGSGSVALRIFNAGSASTAVNILVNFWVIN